MRSRRCATCSRSSSDEDVHRRARLQRGEEPPGAPAPSARRSWRPRGIRYELVFVDDGSRDGSLAILKEAAAARPDRIRVLELARNFGQHPAILAAFENVSRRRRRDARRRPAEPPGGDSEAAREDRRGLRRRRRRAAEPPGFLLAPGRVGAGEPGDGQRSRGCSITDYGCMLRAYSRDVDRGDQPLRRDRRRSSPRSRRASRAGRPRSPVAHAPRRHGESKYSLYRLIRLNFDLMTGFSLVPLQVFGLLGFARRLRRHRLRPLSLRPPAHRTARRSRASSPCSRSSSRCSASPWPASAWSASTSAASTSRSAAARASASAACTAWAPERPGTASVVPRPGSNAMTHRRLRLLRRRARVPEATCSTAGSSVVLVATHRDAPEERAWFPSVAELARAHGIDPVVMENPLDPQSIARVRSARPDLLLLLLLPAPVARGDARGAAARRLEHARVPPAEIPRPRPGQLGGPEGRDRNGRDAPRHDRARRRAATSSTRRPSRSGRTTPPSRCSGASTPAAVTVLARRLEDLKSGAALPLAVPQDESAATRFGKRTPEDGRIDWTRSAKEVHDLVRAVTHPYPGAFTDVFGGEDVRLADEAAGPRGARHVSRARCARRRPGSSSRAGTTATSSCCACSPEGGPRRRDAAAFMLDTEGALMRVLILGVNGFIGNALTERILTTTDWEVFGLDIGVRQDRAVPRRPALPRSSRATSRSTRSGSSTTSRSATSCCRSSRSRRRPPTSRQPLAVFELDFEENLRIVKQAVRYRKRVVFPSTSEVYGMCPDAEFDEDTLAARVRADPEAALDLLVQQAAARPRDLGLRHGQGLQFTLFRPFNWFGPHLDDIDSPEGGLEPRADAVPPQHPLRRADQARGRRHAAALVHVHLRTASTA